MTTEEIKNSERIVDYFVNNPMSLAKLSIAEGRDIMQLASLNAITGSEIKLKKKCYDLLYDCCLYLKRIDLKEQWNIYWILRRATFTDYSLELNKNLDELYRLIYKIVEESVEDTYERTENLESNLVVIVTNQFLQPAHAPTRRVLDYAYTIAMSLKKQVMIVNDASFHFYPCNCLKQNLFPYFLEEYSSLTEIFYKELEIPFIQYSGYMPDLYGINELLRKIYQRQPELVYNISDSCLVADLCRRFTKTVCMPCSNDIPITMCEYLLVGRQLEEKDKLRLRRLEPYQRVIETCTNYELSEDTMIYERAEFGIQDTSFLIGIIGNRLDEEITDEFILLIERVLRQQDVHFMIIGEIEHIERFEEEISNIEKIHFTGKLKEARQAVKLCNIYCNPKRSGGGRSSFEALAYGVPVITLKFGDVFYTCGNEFAVETYDDYLEKINRYITDKIFYETAKEKALKRAEELSDLPGTQKKIFEQIYGRTF